MTKYSSNIIFFLLAFIKLLEFIGFMLESIIGLVLKTNEEKQMIDQKYNCLHSSSCINQKNLSIIIYL